MTAKDAFTTIKYEKENFSSNLKCRLINPNQKAISVKSAK